MGRGRKKNRDSCRRQVRNNHSQQGPNHRDAQQQVPRPAWGRTPPQRYDSTSRWLSNNTLSTPFESRSNGIGKVTADQKGGGKRRRRRRKSPIQPSHQGPRGWEVNSAQNNTRRRFQQHINQQQIHADDPQNSIQENRIRFCVECSTVRRANLMLRDWLDKALIAAADVIAGWSDEVGVSTGSGDEMDWQPEPVTRIVMISSSSVNAAEEIVSQAKVLQNTRPWAIPDGINNQQFHSSLSNLQLWNDPRGLFAGASPVTPPSTPPSPFPWSKA
ncbi:hypothetical protein F5Y16DRAFT_104010 [Xylariaceae sp. FL0255]|nr:hypothetical protein F5Y16DRAFT_104010 [Xylariaceae sp. FL0255]